MARGRSQDTRTVAPPTRLGLAGSLRTRRAASRLSRGYDAECERDVGALYLYDLPAPAQDREILVTRLGVSEETIPEWITLNQSRQINSHLRSGSRETALHEYAEICANPDQPWQDGPPIARAIESLGTILAAETGKDQHETCCAIGRSIGWSFGAPKVPAHDLGPAWFAIDAGIPAERVGAISGLAAAAAQLRTALLMNPGRAAHHLTKTLGLARQENFETWWRLRPILARPGARDVYLGLDRFPYSNELLSYTHAPLLVSALHARAVDQSGYDPAAALQERIAWLETPHPALDDTPPAHLIQTDARQNWRRVMDAAARPTI